MKEHKKLYKSGKNWVIATIAVAILGVAAGQVNALADTTTNAQIGSTDVVNNGKNSAVGVQTDLNKTKASEKNAQSDVNSANNNAENATATKTTTQNTLQEAEKKLSDEQTNNQAVVSKAKQKVAQADKTYHQSADAYAKQQQVVNAKRVALESVKKEIAATPLWNASQAQQLSSFVSQYGEQHNMKFYQYDGKNAFNLDGNYPDFNTLRVKGNREATVGMSINGAGNYDYNVVAVFNHTPNNSQHFIEWHDTYFFAFHNNEPVVLVDYSTNGKPTLVDVSQVTSKYSERLNAFQNEFTALFDKVQNVNKAKLQRAQADLDNAISKLKQLSIVKDNAAQALKEAQAELSVTGDKIANHSMTDLVNDKTNSIMTLKGHSTSALVSMPEIKQTMGSNKQPSLPQTGNKNSAVVLALGAVSAMFGLTLIKKREY